MPSRTITVNIRHRSAATAAVLLGILVLCSWPVRSIIGEWWHHRAAAMVEDRSTNRTEQRDISEETLPDYFLALAYLDAAVRMVPQRSDYLLAAADLRMRLADWSRTLALMGAALPTGAPDAEREAAHAIRSADRAVRASPLDPRSRITLGRMQANAQETGKAVLQIERAALLYPVNSTVRYQVAAAFLAMKLPERALHHAEVLAARDDSYRIADNARERFLEERSPAEYRAYLSRSYLYLAYELAWRASDGSVQHLRRMTPAKRQAEAVLGLFLDRKNINQEYMRR